MLDSQLCSFRGLCLPASHVDIKPRYCHVTQLFLELFAQWFVVATFNEVLIITR